MLNTIEELMRLHPASLMGRPEHRPSDFELFEELESRHLRPRHEYEADRHEPNWMIGKVAAVAAMLIAFVGVLTLFARLSVDEPATAQSQVVAVSTVAERR